MIMKRIVLLISTIFVVNCLLSSATAENTTQYDSKALETINRLCAYIGKPGVYSAKEPNDTSDPINGRRLIILRNNNQWQIDLTIRIAKDVCCNWNLGLTRLNMLSIIENIFDEEAPLLSVFYLVNGEVKDSSFYWYSTRNKHPFSSFISGLNNIIQNIEPTPLPVYVAGDIFLSDFDNVYWYDDIETVKEHLKQFTLDIKVIDDSSTACYFVKNIDGYDLQYHASFTNNKLTSLGIVFPNDTVSLFLEQMKAVYGEPIETTEMAVFLGFINAQNEPNCFLWYTDYTDIIHPLPAAGEPMESISYLCRDNLPHWNANSGE